MINGKEIELFQNIKEEDLSGLLTCIGGKIHYLRKGEFLFRAGESPPLLGIMISGQAQIIKENVVGDRMIIRNIKKGNIFGETYACMGVETIPVSVSAVEQSEVLLLNMKRMLSPCESACMYHKILISNMLGIMARKNMILNEKMFYISHKTIRSRLKAYLYDQAEKAGSNEFEITYNKSELADYLCVDRSAMSRELGIMKKEGLIDYNKNKFQLVNREM